MPGQSLNGNTAIEKPTTLGRPVTSPQHWKQHVPLYRRSNAVPENKVAAMYQRKQATAQQAEAVVDALMKVFEQPLFDWERPRVVVDTWEHERTVVVWEE